MKASASQISKNCTKTILLSYVCLLFLAIYPGNIHARETIRKNISVNTTVRDYEPAVAVRASGCLTCHAEFSSNFITDFGYGSPWFFANPESKNKVGIFNGHIYGDFIAEPGKTGWLTAQFKRQVIIPKASVGFDIASVSGDTLPDESFYEEALKASSLGEYLRALERKKSGPARVIEKKKVFIGAPDAATLEARFDIKPGDEADFKYIKDDPEASPEVEGIESSVDGKYYTNIGEIVCDGDFLVRGTLLLNKPVIATGRGCRIYATGPVFLQGEISYRDQGTPDEEGNLQIVSTEAIFLGVGQRKCDTADEVDPMALRLLKTPARPSIITRAAHRQNIPPQVLTRDLYDKASSLPLEDSSCHDETIAFSRLLLNAPIINSRYSGKFKGLVIAEYALFWQGKTDFEFDPIFKTVPVLPVLRDSDYLEIE